MNRTIVALLFCVFLSYCGGCQNKPAYLKQGFDQKSMDGLILMPAMDCRVNPNPDHKFATMKAMAESAALAQIRYVSQYRVLKSNDLGQVASYTPDMLPIVQPQKKKDAVQPVANAEWVRRLGPSSARWIAVPTVEKVSAWYVGLGAGGSATVSLYIFDKSTGELVWYNKGIAAVRGLGLIDAAVMAMSKPEYMTVAMASGQSALALEKRKKPYILP